MNRALPLIFSLLLALCLAGCSPATDDAQSSDGSAKEQAPYEEPRSGQKIDIGSSGYTLDIPREYRGADPSFEYLQYATYKKDEATTINVYQWISSKGLESTVESLMNSEHKGAVAEMCKKNGLRYACLTSRESYQRQSCRTVSFLFQQGITYTEVEFTFSREYPYAEREAKEIFSRIEAGNSNSDSTTRLGKTKYYLDMPSGYHQSKDGLKKNQVASILNSDGSIELQAYQWKSKRGASDEMETLRQTLIGKDLAPSDPTQTTLAGLPCSAIRFSIPSESLLEHNGMECRIDVIQKDTTYTAFVALFIPEASSEAENLLRGLKVSRSSKQIMQIADSPYAFTCSTSVSTCPDPNAKGKEGLVSSFFDSSTATACNIYANDTNEQTNSLEHYASWAQANVEGYGEEHFITINDMSMLKFSFTETIGETAFNSLGYVFIDNGKTYLLAFRFEGDDFRCQTYAEELTDTIRAFYTA